MASAVAPPSTPKTTTSVDPLYTQALAQAKTALAAASQPIKDEQAATAAHFAQRETDATGVAAALSKLLQPIGPAVNGIYQTAAQNQELAGKGFSQGMQDALQGNTDNLNAMLQQLGQPAQLDSHAKEAGDVLYGLGGYNPGVSFSKQGAAFGSAAELQAGDAILKGQENVKALQGQAVVADQGFQQKLAELAGKLPGDTQDNYMKLHQLSLDDAKFREQVAKDKIDTAYKSATIKLNAGKLKLAGAKFNASVKEFNANYAIKAANVKLAAQRLSIEATKAANAQFNSDRNYQLALGRLGVSQKSLQLRIAQSAFKAANGGYTQAQLTKFTEQANAMANQALHGAFSSRTTNGKTSTTQTGGVPYFQALGGMMKKGIPVQVALDALDRAYPQSAQPTAEALEKTLGPLTPDAIQQQVTVNAGTPAVAGMSMTDPTALLTTGPKVRLIARAAATRGLDPAAVLAVASMEGLSGAIGDGGHAFGPFQLNNAGGVITGMFAGATPQQINDWAWSPAGIAFALDHMAHVARGLTGRAAIDAIVRKFERPLAPDPEVAGAIARYGH